MKFKHWLCLTGIFVATSLSCVATISSCNNGGVDEPPITPDDEACLSFISDRTFSIAGTGYKDGSSVWVRGTGWIINKSDNVLDNYKYWLATNWHVIDGFDGINADYGNIRYADQNINIGDFNTYTKFASFTKQPWDKFTQSGDKSKAIDFYVAEIDFGANLPLVYKTKLDNLNSYWSAHSKHINTFKKNYESTSSLNKKYIAGYPIPNDAPGTPARYEQHVIYSSLENSTFGPHECDEAKTVLDVSDQYVFPSQSQTWMNHGASGSVILNSFKEICGIYWGGWLQGQQKIFYPCASIFLFRH